MAPKKKAAIGVAKKSKTRDSLCPYLVNNLPCATQGCTLSHKSKYIRAWQLGTGLSPCKQGASCDYLSTNTCLWFHPPEHRAQTDRVDDMTRGLSYRESIDVGSWAKDQEPEVVGITDDREVASFNKLYDDEIAVPGVPPLFKPPTHRFKLQKDSDNSSLRSAFPRYAHTFEPLLRSIEVMQPGLDILKTSDIVSNASNMGMLLRIVSNKSLVAERYDLEWKDKTLLVSRWNDDPRLSRSLGRGAGFEMKTCHYAAGDDPVLQCSVSHHRVVLYCFDGLQCVIQSEVDAYCCSCNHSNLNPAAPVFVPLTPFAALVVGDPDDSVITMEEPPAPLLDTVTSANKTLRIHHVGRTIPAPCLVEVKTHKAGYPLSPAPEAQLYFSRRTKLYVAQHKDGVFSPGQGLGVEDKADELAAWERREQTALKKLGALLKVVRSRVERLAGDGVGRVSLLCHCDGSGMDEGVVMRLFERREGTALIPMD